MPLNMWMYDLAREQSPSLEHWQTLCRLTVDSGYHALGIYMEHRFAYPSAPWAHGQGCLQPEMVKSLEHEFPSLQIVPFINLLGHFEGFLYTEGGQSYAEEKFKGMQACPSNEDFVEFARGLLRDTIGCFKSELVHIGGDETFQLGACPKCKSRVDKWAEEEGVDGKAKLYGEHFGPMAELALSLGRRPGVWGDMFLQHPQAMEAMPKQTLIFDWQYFGGCKESAPKFQEAGFEVMLCPSLQTYDAAWFHLRQSEENVRTHAKEAKELNAHGVCLTTWECGLFGAYDTIFPAIAASGRLLSGMEELAAAPLPRGLETAPEPDGGSLFLTAYSAQSEHYEVWARLLGIELNQLGGIFKFTGHRSDLKARFLLAGNPFSLSLHHGAELSGPLGDGAYRLANEALQVAPNEETKGVAIFIRTAVEFARLAERARLLYAKRETEQTVAALALTRQLFDDLANVARKTHERIGGSITDFERCRAAKDHVEKVIVRIRNYGDGALGYVPSFEQITHRYFMPHDQAAWWLINKWILE